jgi:tetratricopeptide (TPR) repeat protein
LSELLSPPYYDEATARSDAFQFAVDFLVIPPAVVTEKQSAKREEAEAWGNKSNNYIVTVMVLAVCLFLFGLAIAIGGQVKYLFVAVGSLIAEAACIAVFVTLLLPVPQMSEDAIQRYAQGVGHAYYAWNLELSAAHSQVPQKADQAIASFTEALALRRDYGAAYQARGNAHLIKAEALLFGRGDPVQTKAELDQAVADFKRAIDLGRGNKDGYWNLGWAYFLAKKYPESIAATKEALKLASELKLGLGLNLAANLLGEGKRAEAMQQLEESISWAAQHPLYSDTFYFRQIIRDLDRLREVQPLEGMVEMEKRLKEAFVSLTYRGTSIVEPTGASIGAFEFAQPVFDAQGNVTERKPMTRFPRGTERVDFAFDFKGMPKDSQIVQKVYWQGLEQASLTRIEKWSGGDSGRAVWFLRSPVEHTLAGLLSGHYTVELYIEGELVQSGSFDID